MENEIVEKNVLIWEKAERIVPGPSLKILVKILEKFKKIESFKVFYDEMKMGWFFCFDTVTVCTRLLEGDFPNYRKILQDNEGDITCELPVSEAIKALKKTFIFSSDRSRAVHLQLLTDSVLFTVNNPQKGKAQSKVFSRNYFKNGDKEIDVKYNGDYINDFLRVTKTPNVELSLYGESLKGILREYGKLDYSYVLMPMRF